MKSLCNLVVAAFLLAAGSFAHATVSVFDAFLSGSNESPSNPSPGTGFATVTIDDVLNTMHVQVTFSGLLGTTTNSHIHCCTAAPGTGTAGVATTTPTFAGFPLGVTSGFYDVVLDMTATSSYNAAFITANGGTTASAEANLFAGMSAGKSYLNIHTTVFPTGEIRGFLTPIPEPEISAMMLAGLGLLGWAGRRRAQRQAA